MDPATCQDLDLLTGLLFLEEMCMEGKCSVGLGGVSDAGAGREEGNGCNQWLCISRGFQHFVFPHASSLPPPE